MLNWSTSFLDCGMSFWTSSAAGIGYVSVSVGSNRADFTCSAKRPSSSFSWVTTMPTSLCCYNKYLIKTIFLWFNLLHFGQRYSVKEKFVKDTLLMSLSSKWWMFNSEFFFNLKTVKWFNITQLNKINDW